MCETLAQIGQVGKPTGNANCSGVRCSIAPIRLSFASCQPAKYEAIVDTPALYPGLAAEGRLTDDEIAAATGRSRSLVERTRKRFVLSGLEVALWDKPRRGGLPKLDERGRATLIALACANPPEGRTCWTMQLLANELVIRQVVPSISDETVRRTLKKTASSRGSKSTGASRRSARAS